MLVFLLLAFGVDLLKSLHLFKITLDIFVFELLLFSSSPDLLFRFPLLPAQPSGVGDVLDPVIAHHRPLPGRLVVTRDEIVGIRCR